MSWSICLSGLLKNFTVSIFLCEIRLHIMLRAIPCSCQIFVYLLRSVRTQFLLIKNKNLTNFLFNFLPAHSWFKIFFKKKEDEKLLLFLFNFILIKIQKNKVQDVNYCWGGGWMRIHLNYIYIYILINILFQFHFCSISCYNEIPSCFLSLMSTCFVL